MEKYCTAGQATDNNIIRHMRIAPWITKATDTHSEYVIIIAFPLQKKKNTENTPQWYGVHAHCLPCLNLIHTEMYLQAQYTN